MPGIQLTGLASGLDTDSLVSQLMAAESVGRTRITFQQARAAARRDGLADVQTKLTAARTAAEALGSATTWTPQQTASSADATKVSARVTAGAGPGGYAIDVQRLASSEQRTYAYVPQAGASTMTINGTVVAIDDTATLDSVAAAINGTTGTGVFAVNAGGQLILAARTTGAGSAFTFSSSAANTTEDLVRRRTGVDALYTVDGGTQQSSASNTVTGALAGVELSLRSPGATTITVSPPVVDQSAVQAKVKAFVDAYNTAQDAIRGQLAEKVVAKATSASQARLGALAGDSTLRDAAATLRRTAASVLSGTGNGTGLDELADIGVSTGVGTGGASSAESLQGRLTFDTAKLTAKLEADPEGVRRLLVSATTALKSSLDPLTQAGGRLAQRLEAADADKARLEASLKTTDDRLARKEESYRKRFALLESSLARLQGQQSSLTAALSQLPSRSS